MVSTVGVDWSFPHLDHMSDEDRRGRRRIRGWLSFSADVVTLAFGAAEIVEYVLVWCR